MDISKIPVLKEDLAGQQKLPTAVFIESIDTFCKEYGLEKVVEAVTGAYNKFKFTEAQFQKYKASMSSKLPEIEKAIELITHLKVADESEIKTKFMLTEGVFTEAVCEEKNVVYLWLGANTMVQYTYDEALALLTKNHENAKRNVDTYTTDLEFIKEQITMIEVNLARLHNYKVKTNQANPQQAPAQA